MYVPHMLETRPSPTVVPPPLHAPADAPTSATTSATASATASALAPAPASAPVRETRGALDDLSLLRDLPVPRPPEICARFAGRVSPWWGFVLYGVLWLFLATTMFTLGMLPVLLLVSAAGAKGAPWAVALSMLLGGAAFVYTWVLFARWVKRRRASAAPLVRDGEIVTGRVFDRWSGTLLEKLVRLGVDYASARVIGRTFRVDVAHEGAMYSMRVATRVFGAPAAGTLMPVLLHRESSLALVFDKKGKSSVVRVTRRR